MPPTLSSPVSPQPSDPSPFPPSRTVPFPGSLAPNHSGLLFLTPLWGTFLLLLLGALYFGKEFLLPVVLAALFSMTVSPVAHALERRGLPTPVTAVLIMALTVLALALIFYAVSEPIAQ